VAIHKLTASKIAKLTDGLHGDGGNLWCQVTNNGAGKSWIFRWTERGTGRERVMGLGPVHTIDLERARELAKDYRVMLLMGKDPRAERDNARLDVQIAAGKAKTVGEVANEYFAAKVERARKSPKWTKMIARHLRRYVHDTIGRMPIQRVDQQTILEKCGLRELWMQQNPTARVVHNHLDRMFRFAIAYKYYSDDNPAAWAYLQHVLPSPNEIHQPEHHPSLDYKDVGRFMQALRAYEDPNGRWGHTTVALLTEFIVLTGVRLSEARLATWKEFDKGQMVWNVPPQHRKTGRNGKVRPDTDHPADVGRARRDAEAPHR
jgi:integrase